MGDGGTKQEARMKSYSDISLLDAEKRLGFEFQSIKVICLSDITTAAVRDGVLDEADVWHIKEKIYNNIVDYIGFEGYPSESTADFSEGNINDLIYTIIGPVLSCVRREIGRDLRLRREKEIVSIDGEASGKGGFVVMDVLSVTERNYVLVVEGKKGSIGEAMKQCLLSMKDMWDNNNGGYIYGFATTGESWRMFSFNGVLFEGSRNMDVLFLGMEKEGGKEEWISNYSAIVDCLATALIEGGYP